MNEETKDVLAAVYIRVSTEDQARQGYSLPEQEKRIREYCTYKRIKIYNVYREDGKSAKNTDGRPAFNKMMAEMEQGKFNAIVIYKLDRFTRSTIDLDLTLRKMEKLKCDLMSVTEEINTKTAFGKFFIRIIVLLAQLEIEQTSERTIMGLEGAIKEGVHIGKKPLGFMPKTKDNTKLIINEEEAIIVRKIFNMYLQGHSYYYIANYLIDSGNTMRKWKDNVIQTIINNRLYCGDIEHRKSIKDKETVMYEDVVPAIISKEIFEECQRIIEKNKKSFGSTLTYMFGKTLYCNKCKTLLKVSSANDKGIKHYICDNCKNFNEKKIEPEILDKITKMAEFSLALTYNAVLVDNDRLSELLNNTKTEKLDDRIKNNNEEMRVLLDDFIIRAKEEKNNKLWNELTYEDKRNFIINNVEAIYIEKIKGSSQQNYKVKVKDIRFKTSKLNELFGLMNEGLTDSVFSNEDKLFSMAIMNNDNYINNYIKRLRNRYNINVEEEVIRFDAHKYKSNTEDNKRRMSKLDDEDLFKVIRVPRSTKNNLKSKLAREKYIYISLAN
ncbi:MAG: recombinase family protein [Bacilli bacterium]